MGRKRKSSQDMPKVGNSPRGTRKIQPMILEYLNQQPGRGCQVKQILKGLGVADKKSKQIVTDVIYRLEDKGKIKRLRNGSYSVEKQAFEPLIGVVDYVNARFAYIVVDDEEQEDIWVSKEDLLGAFDNDRVKVVPKPSRRGRKPEGKVIEIVSRHRDEFVGCLEIATRYAFVIPDFKKMFHDIYICLNDLHDARHNDKVVVKVTRWPERGKKPEGKIVRVLGKAGEHNAEIHSIMAEFGLPCEFPEAIEAEAESISEKITATEINKRKDFRGVTTFTIDPFDAKDFDDALSIRSLPNGNTEVGIHIADVTHYVQPRTALEEEAVERATSVYLVDRTIPMLPERLSNGLCSLRPREEKLTFSAVFELDDEANIKSEWFGRTVIFSDRRFTYEEAQERLENREGDFCEEIAQLDHLAKKIKKDRFEKGAVNFETVELKFKLNEAGKPLGIIPKERKDAHKLIEEFMLLANKRVAEFIFSKGSKANPVTFVYRTHDDPDPEKLDTLANFARRFGHQLDFSQGHPLGERQGISHNLNHLVERVEGKPEQNVLQQLAIRTMAKAQYTTNEKGHFGLSFPHYTHFTSPIRRYPDMMVHRLLQHYLHGGKSFEGMPFPGNPLGLAEDREEFEKLCLHSSAREKRAADAERASVKYKQVEFMALTEDKIFDGMVSGLTEWGIYVEITETKCEGMIRMADLNDDYYELDQQNCRVVGRRNKRMITLGDAVKVSVKATDIDRRTIDLTLEDE